MFQPARPIPSHRAVPQPTSRKPLLAVVTALVVGVLIGTYLTPPSPASIAPVGLSQGGNSLSASARDLRRLCADAASWPGQQEQDFLAACVRAFTRPTTSPSPTPSSGPTVGPSPSPTPSSGPTAVPSPTVSPSSTPTTSPTPTPTPTPTAGWPTAASTGPAAGVVLTQRAGNLTVLAGQVVSGLDIAGSATVHGTLVNSRVRCIGQNTCVSVGGGGLIDRVEVDGGGHADIGVFMRGSAGAGLARADRIHIHNMGNDGLRVDGYWVLSRSLVYSGEGGHGDALQSTGGGQGLAEGNDMYGGDTSCMILAFEGGPGPVDHVVIRGNRFNGRRFGGSITSFAIYANGGTSDIQIIGNTFNRTWQVGPATDFSGHGISVWEDNFYESPREEIQQP